MSKWNRPCRLKKEARPFFNEKLASKIESLDVWKDKYNIDENALEEVKEVFITYGHQKKGNSTDLCSWSNPNDYEDAEKVGSRIHFTIHFPSSKFMEHDKFTKGRMIAGLMDRIQNAADNYFTQFLQEEIDENGNEKK